MPNGKPFKNIKARLYGKGTIAKNSNEIHENAINDINVMVLLLADNSDTILMPKYLDIVYPINCAMINKIL